MNDTKDVSRVSQPTPTPGPFLAKVISHLDPSYMGGLEVEILRASGNDSSEGQLHQVKYMSPFYGVTGYDYVTGPKSDDKDNKKAKENVYNNTQKSYGMWMIAPDPGTTVIIIFIDGDPKRGYWIGCVQDENMNFMVPGIAGTLANVEKEKDKTTSTPLKVPVGEYNKKFNSSTTDPTKFTKPKHPFAQILIDSGLAMDDIRGVTSSSARRETPSMVFGISTPGPLDKDGPVGSIGKKEHVSKSPVSRKGGSTFVMDDGDDKFLRKKPAKADKPEYVSPEQGETGGDFNIPHNELVRIRTRSGHQILLHNSEDLIYISHGSGNSWIEMTANGKIDVYAKDSISFHTENDFNFTAKRDINFNAETGNVNMNATGNIWQTCGGTNETSAGGNIVETGAAIHMNGPAAKKSLLASRVPKFEPWPGHENLDPQSVLPDKTKAVATLPPKPVEPAMFNKYTTKTDTFEKVKGKE
jgi:hypothetical protein